MKPHVKSDVQKVNYVHLPLLPPSKDGWNLNAQPFVGALWEMKFEGFIICLHLLKMPEGSNFGFFEAESELPYSKIPHS